MILVNFSPLRRPVAAFWPILLVSLMALPGRAAESPATVDVGAYSVFRNDLNPDVALSYFDFEDNTPNKGTAQSAVTRLSEERDKMTESMLRFSFDMPRGEDAYQGWFISCREGSMNLSDKTVLRFEVKGTPGLSTDFFQVGIRTSNVAPSTNQGKVFLSELGYKKFPSQFTVIEIPVSRLIAKQPDLDLSRVTHLLIFAVVAPPADVKNQSLWLRNVRWAWDFEKTEKGLMARLPQVLFDLDKTQIKPAHKPYLERVLQVLRARPRQKALVEGHTDNVGSKSYNQKLRLQRAKVIADYLIRVGSVDAARISIAGQGESKPIVSNDTEAGRARNRRVEVTLLE